MTTTTKDKTAFTKNHLGCLDSHGFTKKKPVFFRNVQNAYSFLNIKNTGTRNKVNCETLKRAFGLPLACEFWQIAAGIRENPCPLVKNSPETETHSFSVSERSCEVCHFDKRASLHKVLSEYVGNISKMFSGGQKEQMNIEIRTLLIVSGLQELVFSILKDTVWKGYVMPKKFFLPSSYLWSNVKSTSASNICLIMRWQVDRKW